MFRRKKWTPPAPDPVERERAKKAVAEACQRLNSAIGRQRDVDEVTDELKKIRRENRLAPRIAAALGAQHE